AWGDWLRDLRPLTMERSICYFEAKNRLVADRAARAFRAELAAVLGVEFGIQVDISIMAAPEASALDALEVSPLQPIRDAGNEAAFLTMRSILTGNEVKAPLYLFFGPEGVGKSYLVRWFSAQCRPKAKVFDGLGLLHAMQACLKEQRLLGMRGELA